MNIRTATTEDAPAVRDIARRSLSASYTLSPQTIEGAVTQWYADDAFDALLDDDNRTVLVADDDASIVGFAEGVLVDNDGDGDLLWLHVDPDHRGRSIGTELFDAIDSQLKGMGASRLRGRVLRDNHGGNQFYERHDMKKAVDERVEIDGTQYVENVYVEDEPTAVESVSVDNTTVYIDHDDAERGTVAPFFVAYNDTDRTDRYGYFCSNCDGVEVSMDAMGRAECTDCGNQRNPTRWDAAYL